MPTQNILGYQVSSAGLDGDVDAAWGAVRARNGMCYIACLNPHSYVEARHDPMFRESLKDADILLPDGAGVILAARLLNRVLPERVAGFELFTALSERAQAEGGARYFFLGSTQEVLDGIGARLRRDYPAIEICGVYSPPYKAEFSPEDNEAMIEAVNAARPDVLWVGMTAPKQEKWIHVNRQRLNVPLAAAVGAVFDFYAGTRKRAPQWVCRMGLEWLPRLLREPRRLFRRNFVSSPLFLAIVLRERLRMML